MTLDDVKPRALGHWGCVPGLNFVCANLLAAVRNSAADLRLFIGTGHAGASWLSCTYLEGSLSRAADTYNEAHLDRLCASFGVSGGLTTELSAQYPGVLWPSGELGYALGIAHGHALSAPSAQVVAVLGDGELETAPTTAALHGLRKFRDRSSRLVVIVNFNGLRMGGPSELSLWPDRSIEEYFSMYALAPKIIEGFDTESMLGALEAAFSAERSSGPVPVIVLRTPKGATVPAGPDGEVFAERAASHKVPFKTLHSPAQLAWLSGWLTWLQRFSQRGEGQAEPGAVSPNAP